MSRDVLLHRVVKTETQYAMLLCNLMNRNVQFRNCVLGVLTEGKYLPSSTELVECVCEEVIKGADEDDKGRLDLIIKVESGWIVVEIKTVTNRSQTRAQSSGVYTRYIADMQPPGKLVYLVPRDWVDWWDDSRDATLVSWEELLHAIVIETFPDDDRAIFHFTELLSMRYSPVTFDQQQTSVLLDSKFPLDEILLLIALVEEVGRIFTIRKKVAPHSSAEEHGVYLDNRAPELYFGLWSRHWALIGKEQGRPVCLALKSADASLVQRFRQLVIDLELGDTFTPVDGDWVVAGIDKRWFGGATPARSLSVRLALLLREMRPHSFDYPIQQELGV